MLPWVCKKLQWALQNKSDKEKGKGGRREGAPRLYSVVNLIKFTIKIHSQTCGVHLHRRRNNIGGGHPCCWTMGRNPQGRWMWRSHTQRGNTAGWWSASWIADSKQEEAATTSLPVWQRGQKNHGDQERISGKLSLHQLGIIRGHKDSQRPSLCSFLLHNYCCSHSLQAFPLFHAKPSLRPGVHIPYCGTKLNNVSQAQWGRSGSWPSQKIASPDLIGFGPLGCPFINWRADVLHWGRHLLYLIMGCSRITYSPFLPLFTSNIFLSFIRTSSYYP